MTAWLLLAAAAVLGLAPRSTGGAAASRARRLQLAGALGAGIAAAALIGPVLGAAGPVVTGATAAVVAWCLLRRADRLQDVSGGGGSGALTLAAALTAAALRAGAPPAAALEWSAPAAARPARELLDRAAVLLRLGADPAQAWAELAADPDWQPLAVAAQRSAESGARFAQALDRLVEEARAARAAAALARARRAGVLAVGPLGLCFLPALVCIGIVPMIIGVARSAGVLGAF